MNYKQTAAKSVLALGMMLSITAGAATNPYYTPVKKFSGPYAAIGSGLSQQRYKSTGVGENSAIKSYVALGLSDIIAGGLYVAAEAQLGMNNTLHDKVGTDVFNNLGTDQGYNVKVTETSNDLALMLKVGLPILNNTVVYGTAGPDLSGFKVRTKTAGAHKDKESMELGLAMGAGLETYVTNNLTAGVLYTNTVHDSVKATNLKQFFSDLGAGDVAIDKKKLKVVSNAVMANVTYHF